MSTVGRSPPYHTPQRGSIQTWVLQHKKPPDAQTTEVFTKSTPTRVEHFRTPPDQPTPPPGSQEPLRPSLQRKRSAKSPVVDLSRIIMPLSLEEISRITENVDEAMYDIDNLQVLCFEGNKDVSVIRHSSSLKNNIELIGKKFKQVVAAYKELSNNLDIANSLMKTINRSVSNVTSQQSTPPLEELISLVSSKVTESVLSKVKETMHDELRNFGVPERSLHASPSAAVSAPSFASVLKKPVSSLDTIKLNNGTTFQTSSHVEFSVVPKPESMSRFKSSTDIEKVMLRTLNPVDYNLKVSKVVKARSMAVRIAADNVDLDKLRSSEALAKAGLEIKTAKKFNPRLIIRGVPVSIEKSALISQIICTNDLHCGSEDLKVIHTFRTKKNPQQMNVVVEVNADVRRQILAKGILHVGWSACHVEDHILVSQCFKCLQFGHLAKDCPQSHYSCSKCAGHHDSRSCEVAESHYKCANCLKTQSSTTNHCATDHKTCPVILNKIRIKVLSTNY